MEVNRKKMMFLEKRSVFFLGGVHDRFPGYLRPPDFP